MALHLALGLSPLLADPAAPTPGGYCRDELLFAPLDFGQPGDDFEVREVLSADLPMASGSEDDVGDLVVIARAGVGGPLRPDAAEHLLDRWRRAPRSVTLDAALSDVGLTTSTLLVADPYESVRIASPQHPLHGLQIAPVRPVRDRLLQLRPAGDLEGALAILRLCAVHQFAVALTERDR